MLYNIPVVYETHDSTSILLLTKLDTNLPKEYRPNVSLIASDVPSMGLPASPLPCPANAMVGDRATLLCSGLGSILGLVPALR